MKMRNIDIVNTMNMLDSYAIKRLPQKISYAITRNLVIISNDYGVYERALKRIFDNYKDKMIKDDDGNIVHTETGIPIVSDDVIDAYNNEISELLGIEVDINFYHIPKDVFDYSDDTGRYDAMSARDIMMLESILCDKD